MCIKGFIVLIIRYSKTYVAHCHLINNPIDWSSSFIDEAVFVTRFVTELGEF